LPGVGCARQPPLLFSYWSLEMRTLSERTERGNTLLVGIDSDRIVAIYKDPEAGVRRWTIFEYQPENYPSGRMWQIEASVEEMVAHVLDCYRGWLVKKLNLPGLVTDDEGCLMHEELR
jgi:hypothetical protein